MVRKTTKTDKTDKKQPKIEGGKTNSGLNLEQEAFCQLYVSSDKEFFGNGVQSYIEVYGPDTSKQNWYKTACSSASQLLSNIKVCNRINELLEGGGFNDVNIDKELLFLISQHSELSTKLSAIKEYNRLKARVEEKVKVDTKIEIERKH